MKGKMNNGCIAIGLALSLAASSAGAFELGRADLAVYAADGHTELAKELSGYLHKVFGREFPVEKMPSDVAPDLSGIFVGAKPSGCDVAWDASRECCARVVKGGQVWLFGNDAGKALNGTADSVYEFLERFAGVRWLWPGDVGTVADRSEPVALKDETWVYVTPFRRRLTNSFLGGRGRFPGEGADLAAWTRHRHVGSSLVSKGSGFQHAFGSLMPRQKYGREHPEYYALVAPERWIGEPKPAKPTRLSDSLMPGPWQLCTSNPDVRRIIAEKLIAAKTDVLQSISPNDGYGFCECPACRAQDAEGQGIGDGVYDLTDRMYDFLSDIAWQVYKASPRSKVGLFSYSFYDKVPVRKHNLPPNVYLSCCYLVYRMNARQEAELAEKLTGLAGLGAQIVGREYWGTHYTMRYPLSHSRKIDRNLKLLHRLGAAGIYGEPGGSFAPRASDLYLLARLAWDPTVNRESELRDFCEKAFGKKAAKVMYDLFEAIEDCVERKIEVMEQNRSRESAHYHNTYAEFNRYMTTIFDADFSKMCDVATKKALKLADTPERKARVSYIASGLAFAKIQTEALRSFADLAAAGNNMPLTMPSDKQIVMEKSNLFDVIKRALEAEGARRKYSGAYHGSNALTSDRRSEALSLRPWGVMAERARLLLRSDRYNYLVNGAFEYSGYSWDVKGDGTAAYTTAKNHDADDNWMVQCHHKQGICLELTIPPGGKMNVRNLRKVSPALPAAARAKLFARYAGDVAPEITAAFGGSEMKGVDVSRDVPEDDSWHEIRFRPVEVLAGDHDFEIKVKNPGARPLVVHLDGLDLRMKSVK